MNGRPSSVLLYPKVALAWLATVAIERNIIGGLLRGLWVTDFVGQP